MSVDSNVLFYALDADAPEKQAIADSILERSLAGLLILTTQAIGEFLNVTRRKRPSTFGEAALRAAVWNDLFPVVPTHPEHVLTGAQIAQRHKLQFWDAVMLATAAANGVDLLLSEDMQDGAILNGVTILNPFSPANRARLDEALA